MTAIPKLESSVYDTAPDELRPTLDALVAQVAAAANWKVRKKTMLDVLSVIDVAAEMSPQQREELDRVMLGIEDGTLSAEEAERALEMLEQPDPEAPDAETVSMAADLIPMFVAAILERLNEKEIVTVEQAAVYLLSAHDEHAVAAEEWLQADHRHAKEFKRLLRDDHRYADLFDLILAPDYNEDEDPEDAGA